MVPTDAIQRLRRHIEKTTPISDDEFTRLVLHFHPRSLRRGEHLYQQGAVCSVVGFIVRGCVRNYHIEEDGSEYIVNFALEEWWVADLQSFHREIPSMFNVQALERCELLVASKPQFESAIANVAAFGMFYRAKVSRAYTAASMKIVVERSETAEERYRKLVEHSPHIVDRVPQRHLASYLGIQPQSLSRIRKKLADANVGIVNIGE